MSFVTGLFPVWALLALGFSFLGAVIIGYNHVFKLDGRVLAAGRLAGVLPPALVAWCIWPWPHDAGLYVAAAGMGILLAAGDIVLANASAKYGARLAALYVPQKMLLGFVVWLVLEPASGLPLIHQPWRLAVIAVAFGCSGWALAHIRRNDMSWRALGAVMPVAVFFMLGDVVAKYLLPVPADGLAHTLGAAAAFLLMTNVSTAVVGILAGGKLWVDMRAMVVAAGFGVILYGSIIVLLVALTLAPNPGYVAAVTVLSAVWLALWASVVRGERNSLSACLLLVLAAMLVAWAGAV